MKNRESGRTSSQSKNHLLPLKISVDLASTTEQLTFQKEESFLQPQGPRLMCHSGLHKGAHPSQHHTRMSHCSGTDSPQHPESPVMRTKPADVFFPSLDFFFLSVTRAQAYSINRWASCCQYQSRILNSVSGSAVPPDRRPDPSSTASAADSTAFCISVPVREILCLHTFL